MSRLTTNVHKNIPTWLIPAVFAFYLIVNIISWTFPFFWDTLLTSSICNDFIDNGWNYGIPANELDAGHPPLFYTYIYAWWTTIGYSLTISHVAMLPFLWIMAYQFIQVCARLLETDRAVITATILFCLETTILAQSTMVSYDIVLLAFYLFGLRYVMDNKMIPVMIAGIVLSLISLRGLVAVFALLSTEWILYRKSRSNISILIKHVPAFIAFGAWCLLHYNIAGWAIFSTSEQWADHRGLAGFKGSLKNIAVILRNLLEPGRLALYGFILMGYFTVRMELVGDQFKRLGIMVAIPLFIFSLFFLLFNNPIGHRYFMIIFALSIPLLIVTIGSLPFKKIALFITGLCFVSGHFWYGLYPASLSKGWDASLAHVPYFKVKAKTWNTIESEGLTPDLFMAHFPLDVSLKQSDLKEEMLKPQAIEDSMARYIMVSNINNDFETEDITTIQDSCSVIATNKRAGIYIDLYHCPKSD